jgi:four helix bundle protein
MHNMISEYHMIPPMRNLESFDAWKQGRVLGRNAYELTLAPGLSRHFALIDQIRRAALSIPANIAEGYALGTTPQFLRCLRIALGSTTELRSHLDLMRHLQVGNPDLVTQAITQCDRVIQLLLGLSRKLAGKHSRISPPASRSQRGT